MSDDAQRRLVEAGVAALEGRLDEATGLGIEAVELFEELGWAFVAAEVRLHLLLELRDRPELRAWADEARATFQRLGNEPYLRWLDELEASPQHAPVGAAS